MRRLWAKRVLWSIAGLLLVLGVVSAATIGPLLLAPNRYGGTPSIEARADFRSPQLMQAAWAMPVARLYGPPGFEYQDNQSFCGPASLANALRSIGEPVTQHQVLGGSTYDPWFGILIGGMTLDELGDLARLRTGRPVRVARDMSLDAFRRELSGANDPARRLLVNFHRGPLFGRGHGHFSPILAYLADRDLALVGDVNRAFRPFLVSSETLWRAVDTIDTETGQKRGLLILQANGDTR